MLIEVWQLVKGELQRREREGGREREIAEYRNGGSGLIFGTKTKRNNSIIVASIMAIS